MSAEDKLTKWFYESYWGFLISAIVCIILVVLFFIFRRKFFDLYKHTKGSKITLIVIILLFLIGHIFAVVNFSLLAKDKKAVDNRQFLTVTGTVIGFNKSSVSDYKTYYSHPIIKIEGANETIVLNVKGITEDNITIGETYTFIYLEHTLAARKKE